MSIASDCANLNVEIRFVVLHKNVMMATQTIEMVVLLTVRLNLTTYAEILLNLESITQAIVHILRL